MNTGFWIFATAVLMLVVLHEGFRRFALRTGGVFVAVAVLSVLGYWLYHRHEQQLKNEEAAAIGQPQREQALIIGCPAGKTLAMGGDGQAACFDPAIVLHHCPPGDTSVGCEVTPISTDDVKWDCPAGQIQAPAANATGDASCYDPHDPKQLAQHLKECAPEKVVPAHPRNDGHDLTSIRPMADKRGIPCNVYDQFDQPNAQP
jgi:hypothetical protein